MPRPSKTRVVYSARDVASAIEALAPLDSGVPGDELGFVYGDPDRPIRGVGCLWNVHAASIRAAARLGLDMLVCHEKILLSEQKSPWYGFGENQTHMPQAARDLGAEALIIGEMSEFIVIAALEMGLPVIESLHSASESPAIRRQASLLAERLPGLGVRFIPNGAPALAQRCRRAPPAVPLCR